MDMDRLARILSVGEDGPVSPSDPRVRRLGDLAEEMGEPPPDRDAPVREIVARLGDNWSALIMFVLATGKYRHATLKRVISHLAREEDISQRMLTLRLRALERDGLVVRTVYDTVPPRVEYALSEMGSGLQRELARVIAWVHAHEDEILAARKRFSDD